MSHFDFDRDGVLDHADNAPFNYNPDQRDSDGDRLGDAADSSPLDPSLPSPLPDTDIDGVNDVFDNAPATANPSQADADDDGVGDVADNAPNHPNPSQVDSDRDGAGDAADADDDGDGIRDQAEHAPRQLVDVTDSTVNEGAWFELDLKHVFGDDDVANPDADDVLGFRADFDTNGDGVFDDAAPWWLTLDASGRLSGSPGDEHYGLTSFGMRITAADAVGSIATDQFTLFVQGENDAPRAGSLKGLPADEDGEFAFDLKKHIFDVDTGDDVIIVSLAYDTDSDKQADDEKPGWLVVSESNSIFSGTVDDSEGGSFTIFFTVADRDGATATGTAPVFVRQTVDESPFLTEPIPDVTLKVGEVFSLSGFDYFRDDAGKLLSLKPGFDSDGDGESDIALPTWLSFDQKSGILQGVPKSADAGTYTLFLIAHDGSTSPTFEEFVVTVTPDVIKGGVGGDTLEGTAGGDIIDGGAGADEMVGGQGNDTYVVDHKGDVVTEMPGEGEETVEASVNYRLPDNVENLVLTGTGRQSGTGNASSNDIEGGSGNNKLDGGAGDDTLSGEGGDDKLVGGAGNDVLDGGTGNDLMTGGAGDDVYVLDGANDRIEERKGDGVDSVQSSQSFKLERNLENLELTGTDPVNGTGNNGANVLLGNGAANVLGGGGGSDTLDGAGGGDVLIGGTGDDVLRGGAGADVFVFKGNSGDDVILDFEDGVDLLKIDGARISAQWIGRHVQVEGGDTVIDFSGNQIMLAGVNASSIGLEDFLIG